jgi:hypothetical protein
MDIILSNVRLVSSGKQVIFLDIGARGVWMAQRGFDILVWLLWLIRLLVQKLVNVPS